MTDTRPAVPTPEQLADIYAHAVAAHPGEACGFLHAVTVHRCVNILDTLHEHQPDAYRTAATGYAFGVADLRALEDSFDSDDPVRVIYHSHPDVGAYLSAEDVRFAVFEGQPLYPVDHLVIDATAAGVRGARLFGWSAADGGYVEAYRFGDPQPPVLARRTPLLPPSAPQLPVTPR